MATANEIKMRARLRRFHIYRMKKLTGKTDKELGKELGISPSQVNHLCRMVQYELEGRNFKEERNERFFKYLLQKLVPITDQIKEIAKNDGQG